MQKKRARTRKAILTSAHQLIAEFGFEQTSMESIAGAAEIATGTLYNYYASKPALLIAIFDDLTRELLAKLPPRSSDPFDQRTALGDLDGLLRYFCEFIFVFPKPVMRQLIAQMFLLDPEDIAHLAALDMQIITAITPILADLHHAGLLTDDVDIEQAAILIYGAAVMQHQAYISLPMMDRNTLMQNISWQLEVIFQGLLRR